MRLESATKTLITSEAAADGGHIKQLSEKLKDRDIVGRRETVHKDTGHNI
jgi:hypothetical protein